MGLALQIIYVTRFGAITNKVNLPTLNNKVGNFLIKLILLAFILNLITPNKSMKFWKTWINNLILYGYKFLVLNYSLVLYFNRNVYTCLQ